MSLEFVGMIISLCPLFPVYVCVWGPGPKGPRDSCPMVEPCFSLLTAPVAIEFHIFEVRRDQIQLFTVFTLLYIDFT